MFRCCWERVPVIVNYWPVGNGRSRKRSCEFTTKLVDMIFGVSYINTRFFSVIPVVTASKLHRRHSRSGNQRGKGPVNGVVINVSDPSGSG